MNYADSWIVLQDKIEVSNQARRFPSPDICTTLFGVDFMKSAYGGGNRGAFSHNLCIRVKPPFAQLRFLH